LVNEKDNVVITLFDLQPGDEIRLPSGEAIAAQEQIPANHKIALHAIKAGEAIIKYGETIAKAAADIPKGTWIHRHNIA